MGKMSRRQKKPKKRLDVNNRQVAILIVSENQSINKNYRNYIEGHGCMCEIVSTFGDMRERMRQAAWNGLMVDLRTKLKYPSTNPDLTNKLFETYPLVTVRWMVKAHKIAALFNGEGTCSKDIENFLQACSKHGARRIRAHERFPLNLPVRICPSKEFKGAEQTVTIDVSESGCFVFTTQAFERGQILWLDIPELPDKKPIKALIRRIIPWGKGHQIPGVGLEFHGLTPDQIGRLRKLF